MMPKTIDKVLMELCESIRQCGPKAVQDLRDACDKYNVEDILTLHRGYTTQHVAIAQEVWDRWHTLNNFKVGDKVYVVPLTFTTFNYCIRATVTEVNNDGFGYRLRAFEEDLPGIYMFNMWDKDLQSRTSKKNRPVPSELLIK